MSDTGFVLCTSGANIAGAGTDWTTPGNITADDSSNASVSLGAGASSDDLAGTAYGFTIPTNVVITRVEYQARITITGNNALGFNFTKNGSTAAFSAGAQVTSGLVTDATDFPPLTPAEANANTFGVLIGATTGGETGVFTVDALWVRITYQAGPIFADASVGAPDAGGAWSFTGTIGEAGNIFIVQFLQDGATDGAIAVTSAFNIEDLAGTDGAWTQIPGPNGDGSFPVGSAARQFLYIGRALGPSTPTIGGTNSTSEDLFGRIYRFRGVSTGTTLATVIEGSGIFGSPNISNPQSILGGTGTAEEQAQSFVCNSATTVLAVSAMLMKFGSPTDNLIVEIQTDSSGSPSGTVVGTGGSISCSTLTSGSLLYQIAINAPLSAATTYWIVFRRSGARDTTNRPAIHPSLLTTSGVHKVKASGAWGADAGDDLCCGPVGGGFISLDAASSNTASDAPVIAIGPDRLALNFVGVNDDNAISTFTGETGGDWVFAVSPYADSGGTDGAIGLQIDQGVLLTYLTGTGGGDPIVGTGGVNEERAQSFVAGTTGWLDQVSLVLAKAASPTDNLVIEIQSDSSDSPSGTVLASSSIIGTTLTTSFVQRDIYIPLAVTSGTKYWIVARRSGARDATNYYFWQTTDAADAYASGGSKTKSSGSWGSTDTQDRTFATKIYGSVIDGGTGSIVDIDAWGVVGFALIGTTIAAQPKSLPLPNRNMVAIRR